MKKKILAICLVAALAATAAISGTLAYFTDTDEATNTFTAGNVQIAQNEQQRGENGLEAFEQNQAIFPAVHSKLVKGPITVDGYDFNIRSLEGNYVDKIVNVTNTGSKDAYVRTIIAIPNMNGYDDSVDASENPFHWNYLDATDFKGTGFDWNGSNDAAVDQSDKVSAVVIGGVEYDLYVATYNAALPAGKTTSPSMVGFYLDDSVGYDETGYFSVQAGKVIDLDKWMDPDGDGKAELKILVATQACQTEGFADAWEALDTAFGDITAANHPWAE